MPEARFVARPPIQIGDTADQVLRYCGSADSICRTAGFGARVDSFARLGTGPGKADGLRLISGSIEFAQLDIHFDLAWLAVADMHPELDIARVTGRGVKGVTPLEPGFALGAGLAGLAAHGGLFKGTAGSLGRLDPDAPITGAVSFLVGD